jgi:hypothetical protein
VAAKVLTRTVELLMMMMMMILSTEFICCGYIMNNERSVGRYLEESECDVFKTQPQQLFTDNKENRGKP